MSATLDEFKKYSAFPPQPDLVLKWKAGGRKIIGWACNYLPEEIIHAAGMMPYRVSGGVGEIKMEAADSVLHIYSCSFTRTCLQRLISGDYDFLDGFFNCGTCDGMRRLGDAWSSKSVNAKIPLPYAISVPTSFTTGPRPCMRMNFQGSVGLSRKITAAGSRMRPLKNPSGFTTIPEDC